MHPRVTEIAVPAGAGTGRRARPGRRVAIQPASAQENEFQRGRAYVQLVGGGHGFPTWENVFCDAPGDPLAEDLHRQRHPLHPVPVSEVRQE